MIKQFDTKYEYLKAIHDGLKHKTVTTKYILYLTRQPKFAVVEAYQELVHSGAIVE